MSSWVTLVFLSHKPSRFILLCSTKIGGRALFFVDRLIQSWWKFMRSGEIKGFQCYRGQHRGGWMGSWCSYRSIFTPNALHWKYVSLYVCSFLMHLWLLIFFVYQGAAFSWILEKWGQTSFDAKNLPVPVYSFSWSCLSVLTKNPGVSSYKRGAIHHFTSLGFYLRWN